MTKQECVNFYKLSTSEVRNIEELPTSQKFMAQDEDEYMYFVSISNLRSGINKSSKLARFFCGNPYTQKNIENYIKRNIGEHIILDDFKQANSAKDLITFRCVKHNLVFEKCWNIIKNGQHCPECGMEKYKNNRKNDIEYIKREAKYKYGLKIISNTYENNLKPLAFICMSHPNKGIQYRSWSQIITSQYGCEFCYKEAKSEIGKKSHHEFLQEIDKSKCKIEVIGDYTGCKNKIKVKCKKCGNLFMMRPDHILNGVGCPKCLTSKGEESIKIILDKANVNYICQHRFGDCICNKRDMPFDFYIPSLNTVIEYDGIQHYKPVKIFGGVNTLKIQNIRDSYKNYYCNKNKINMIRIPYWEFENIEKIINNIIQ